MKNISDNAANIFSPFHKLLLIVATLIMIALVLMFAMVAFAVILVAGSMAWGYLWWKTRHLREQMRNFRNVAAEAETFEGEIIEGEAIRVVEPGERRS